MNFGTETLRFFRTSLLVALLTLLLGTLTGCSSNPLIDAAQRGDTRTVRTLLDQGEKADFEAAFWTAACSGQIETTQLFLERGANANYVYRSSYSPLQCAAYLGRPELVNLLLQHGADREYKGTIGMTALEIAKKLGRGPVVKVLDETPVTPSAPRSPLSSF